MTPIHHDSLGRDAVLAAAATAGHPHPLRERAGRGVASASSTLRTRRLVVLSPPLPNPLPRGEREPEVPSAKGVIANSTVLPPRHRRRKRDPGVRDRGAKRP